MAMFWHCHGNLKWPQWVRPKDPLTWDPVSSDSQLHMLGLRGMEDLQSNSFVVVPSSILLVRGFLSCRLLPQHHVGSSDGLFPVSFSNLFLK